MKRIRLDIFADRSFESDCHKWFTGGYLNFSFLDVELSENTCRPTCGVTETTSTPDKHFRTRACP